MDDDYVEYALLWYLNKAFRMRLSWVATVSLGHFRLLESQSKIGKGQNGNSKWMPFEMTSEIGSDRKQKPSWNTVWRSHGCCWGSSYPAIPNKVQSRKRPAHKSLIFHQNNNACSRVFSEGKSSLKKLIPNYNQNFDCCHLPNWIADVEHIETISRSVYVQEQDMGLG